MPQLAIAVAGAAAGFSAFGPGILALGLTGSQLGFAAGSLVGGALFAPTVKTEGPRLSDTKAAQVSYGAVIAYVEGHPGVGGNLIWMSDKRESRNTTSSGKGGGGSESTTYTYDQDLFFELAENELQYIRRVWKNGELVATFGADAAASSYAAATEHWDELIFYGGGPTQLPDPTYEAWAGVGNAPAYRTRGTVMLKGVKEGTSGQIPVFVFEVVAFGTQSAADPAIFDAPMDADVQDTVSAFATASITNPSGISFAGGKATLAGVLGVGTPRVTYSAAKFSPATPPIIAYSLEMSDVIIGSGSTDFQSIIALANGAQGVEFGFVTSGAALQLAHRFVNGGGAVINDGPITVATPKTVEITVNDGGAGVARIYVDNALIAEAAGLATDYPFMTLSGWGVVVSDGSSATHGVLSWTVDSLKVYYGLPPPPDAVPLLEPTLQEWLERQCVRGGRDPSEADATACAGRNVHASVLSRQVSPRQAIELAMLAYQVVVTEDDKLRFTMLGAAPAADIPYADLVPVEEGASLLITDGNDTELPVQAFVNYMNLWDDYQDGSEPSDRLVSDSQNTTTIELPFGFTPTEAKRIAEVNVLRARVEARRFAFKLTRKYSRLQPGDVVTLHDAYGATHRARLKTLRQVGGVFQCDAVGDDATVFGSTAVAAATGYTNSTVVRLPIATTFEPLDIPILSDAHDDAGFYAVVKAATGSAGSYPGAALFKSLDDVTYSLLANQLTAAVFGTCSTTLAAGPTGVFDEAATVTVDVGDGQLASVTRADILNGTAAGYAIGIAGRWELLYARNAALLSAGVYLLSGLLRGRRGTEWAVGTHAAGDKVVLLSAAALARIGMSNAELGIAEYFKAVTLGRTTATADGVAFTDNGVGLKPFAPVHLRVARDGAGNATLTFMRRTRLACRYGGALGTSVPVGEAAESYELEIWDSAYSSLKRTLTAASSVSGVVSFSYSAAQQTADFGGAQTTIYARGYQRSARVGRGTVAQAQG